METDKDGNEESVSMLLEGGDHGLQISRILAREPSTSFQSFHSYYQRTEGVVPFEWELMPGTPKNLPREEGILPPLSPPPSVLSSNLPKPRIDDQLQSHRESWIWRKIKILNKEGRCHMIRRKKRSIIGDHAAGSDHDEGCKKIGESDGGDLRALFDFSSTSSSSSTYNSSSSRGAMESSNIRGRQSLHDGPFCCKTPWNITLVLDEENKKVYYCREHRTAYTLENSALISKIMLTSAPSLDQQPSFRSYYRSSISDDGVPFHWEKQPGTPIHPPETEVIPPPSPPPAVHSCGLSLPNIQVDDDGENTIRRRPLISFLGAKSKDVLQINDVEDRESTGNLLHILEEKSKRLSIFSKNPFRAHLCFLPRTLS